ncbi:hypothetical protein GPL15_01825 [Clostridium sp. MCC353]|uniref:hypothetical protein n=1 Tax=Clostridium sp. MCC353 TaxID=2592646 RepID=UPI001C035352|nr:hypothetical protein [Clostridium sp. MCC353]MBT9775246.1 hypothetical protein [Clostridium sp. MCC353]
MWNYTKCTSADREEKLNRLADIFSQEKNCVKYLSEVQKYIHSTQTSIVLLQDVEANVLIEMDYVPVNDYIFHVTAIEENGLKNQGPDCSSIDQAIGQFKMWTEAV